MSGDSQLAEYIMALLSDANTFVPQTNENESAFFEKLEASGDSLWLPDCITQDLLVLFMPQLIMQVLINFFSRERRGTGKTEAVKQLQEF